MKTINVLAVAGLLVFALLGWSAYGHGETTGMTGSAGMMSMMDLMHKQMDGNQAVDCDVVGDAEMMGKGEDMMEDMMGHNDHEKAEESMNKEDHDALHTMMGLWASGCVGEENVATMMDHYGISNDRNSGGANSVSWPSISLGAIIGAVGTWVVGRLLVKKVVVG